MKIVITGGAGFIGANLCRQLLEIDPSVNVIAFDDLSTGSASSLDGTEADRLADRQLGLGHLLAVDESAVG